MNGIMHIFLAAHARLLVTMTGKKHLTFSILCAILFGLSGRERPDRAWYLGVAQLVARYLGVVEAAGSSPVTQTNISYEMNKKSSQIVRFRLDFCLLCYCLFASTIPKMVWCIVSA